MTKLEQKLIQLGYECKLLHYTYDEKLYVKKCNHHQITFSVNNFTKKCRSLIFPISYYVSQQDIDNLQQAFNQLQQDLEVLKEC